MTTLPIALGGLVALLVFMVGYTFLVPKTSRGFSPDNKKEQEDNKGLKFFVGLTNEIMLALPETNKPMKKPKRDAAIESLLVRSGNPWNVTVSEFKLLKWVGLFLGFVIGLVVGIPVGLMTPVPSFVVIALCAFTGFYIPTSKHKDLAARRDQEFKRQLPEALDLIHIALSGGSSFQRAIDASIPSMQQGIVRTEFERISRDINSGATMERALDRFAERAPSDSVKTFARSVQSAIKTNAPLAEILAARAKASREEFFAYIHQKVAQLESKIWMILSPTMLPALMIITILPSSTIMAQALG